MKRRAILLVTMGAAAWAKTSSAATIVVDTTAQSISGDPSDGHCSLGEAMASADGDVAIDTCTKGSGDDDITLPAGTYAFTRDWGGSSPIGRALPIVTTNISVHGADATTTILQQTSGTMEDLVQVQPSASFEIDHVAITVGHTTGPSPWGFAIAWNGATITLDHVDAHDLETTGVRFFVDLRAATAHFTSFTYRNNHMPTANGGEASGDGTTVDVQDSTFTNNDATYLFANPSLTLSLARSTFDSNKGHVALLGDPSSLTVTDCVFTNNDTTSIPDGPGVLRLGSGTTTITGSTFDGNKGNFGGAIAFSGSSTFAVRISTSTFHGNASKRGGAIDVLNAGSGTLLVDDTTFAGNDATAVASDPTSGCGGAIASDSSLAIVLGDVTIAGNTAETRGGGICQYTTTGTGVVTMANTIVASNTVGATTPSDCSTATGKTISSAGYNLVSVPTACTLSTGTGDQIGTASAPLDAKLAPYGDVGGKTNAMAPYASSSAVGAGNPSTTSAAACASSDQEGTVRPAGGCTIGAIQTTVPDPLSDAGVDAADAVAEVGPDVGADSNVIDAFDAARPETTPDDAAFDVFNEAGPHPSEKTNDDGCGCRMAGGSDDATDAFALATIVGALAVIARRRR